jgi:hypothetical protein
VAGQGGKSVSMLYSYVDNNITVDDSARWGIDWGRWGKPSGKKPSKSGGNITYANATA